MSDLLHFGITFWVEYYFDSTVILFKSKYKYQIESEFLQAKTTFSGEN